MATTKSEPESKVSLGKCACGHDQCMHNGGVGMCNEEERIVVKGVFSTRIDRRVCRCMHFCTPRPRTTAEIAGGLAAATIEALCRS